MPISSDNISKLLAETGIVGTGISYRKRQVEGRRQARVSHPSMKKNTFSNAKGCKAMTAEGVDGGSGKTAKSKKKIES